VLLPSLAAAKGDEFRALARRCLDLVVVITVPVALFLAVAAGALIDFLGYDEGFDNSIVLLRILAFMGPLAAVGVVAGTVLLASNHERAWAKVAIAAAVLNPTVNFVLITVFSRTHENGAIGSAITTVLTELFMFTWAMILIPRGTFGRENLRVAACCLLAGAVMTLMMLLALPFGLFAVFFAGCATYGAGVLLLRAVTIEEMRDLLRVVVARKTDAAPAAAPTGTWRTA
jgi:O-antigen/teichoic acid export membrane protein